MDLQCTQFSRVDIYSMHIKIEEIDGSDGAKASDPELKV